VFHPRRIAGRRGEPGRAPGDDDARRDVAGSPRAGRHFRRAAAAVGGHRGARRPAGRPGRCTATRTDRDPRPRPQAPRAGGRMNNVVNLPLSTARRPVHAPPPRLALLGTGNVGAAFVARWGELRGSGVELPAFAWLSNSRALGACADDAPACVLERLRAAPARGGAWSPWVEAEALRRGDVLVDASASDLVAGWHCEWLARGIHVVTANKLANGIDLPRAQAIALARREGGACYGDSATVGAGLPLLRSIRALVAGGDRIRAVEGVLSGSLGWLL